MRYKQVSELFQNFKNIFPLKDIGSKHLFIESLQTWKMYFGSKFQLIIFLGGFYLVGQIYCQDPAITALNARVTEVNNTASKLKLYDVNNFETLWICNLVDKIN